MTNSPLLADARVAPAGDAALVVEFGDVIARAVNDRVRMLDAVVRAAALSEIIATVPTYRSLLVYYDPSRTSYTTLAERLRTLEGGAPAALRPARRWAIPVCYGDELGFELEDVARHARLSSDAVVCLHTELEYMVYMIGFSPGFAYLGELPPALGIPRKTVPRPLVPAGTIQVGGMQTAISSMPMPSGWYIVGRTPAAMYDPRRPFPFLLDAGDRVRFVPIDRAEFDRLAAAAVAGSYVPTAEPA